MSISRLIPYYVNKLTGVSVWDHPAMPRTGSRAPSTTGSTCSSGSAKLATIRNRKTKAQRATPQSPPASPLPAAKLVTPSLHAATYCNTDAEVPKAEVESDGVEATENEVKSVEEKSYESEDTLDKLESVVEEGGRKDGGKGAGEDGENAAAAAVALSMAVTENVAAAAEEATAGAAVVAEAAAGTYSHSQLHAIYVICTCDIYNIYTCDMYNVYTCDIYNIYHINALTSQLHVIYMVYIHLIYIVYIHAIYIIYMYVDGLNRLKPL